jgi:hypothetical protein
MLEVGYSERFSMAAWFIQESLGTEIRNSLRPLKYFSIHTSASFHNPINNCYTSSWSNNETHKVLHFNRNMTRIFLIITNPPFINVGLCNACNDSNKKKL